ncbi:MAG: InlB B-repeat-containing protein, partial [Clostridia bacterium]|nr:InlB B-repeat-containing protein [Clostridia bacterium]
ASESKNYLADLPDTAAATKDGYNVTDWVYYDADDNEITDGKMPAGNVTAKATQSGIPYSLSYVMTGDIPDGVTAPTDSNTYYIGDTVTLETVSPVTGYTFSGWKQDGTVKTSVTFGAGNIEVTGEWTEGQSTVNFVHEDGSTDPVTGRPGSPIPQDLIPEITDADQKDGYDAEWDNIPTTFPTDGSSTPTVKVKYTPKPVNVTFLDEDGEVASEAENVPYNEAVPSAKVPDTSKPGKNFAGWVIKDTDIPFDPTKPIEGQLPDGWTEGIVLSPVYNISDSYYVADGVDKDGNITYASTPAKQFAGDPGDEYEVPGEDVAVSDKYKDQLVFKGWSLTEGGDVITPEGKLGEENAKYYAIYEVKEYNVKYLVDGTEVANEDVAFGGNLADTQPADPSKEGYKFAGWKDKDGKKPDDYGTMPAKDLVFEAQWVSEDVSATFMKQKLNGDYITFETIPQTVGQPIITPETSAYNPFKFGYKFTGWQDENGKAPEDYDGMPSEDVTFYAQYELDETFIALAIGGAVVSGVVVGSVFAGNAALITAGAIVGGVVLIGGAIALAKHTYKVTYYVDGDVYKTYYILEGTKVLVPSDPVREGREFTGWDKPIPEKMPANDLEFNATFDKAGNGSKGTNGNTNGYADTDCEIPATGSAAAGISAFAVIASAAAAAYVLSVRKKKEY